MGVRKNKSKVNIPPEAEEWYEYFPVADLTEKEHKRMEIRKWIENILFAVFILWIFGFFNYVKDFVDKYF